MPKWVSNNSKESALLPATPSPSNPKQFFNKISPLSQNSSSSNKPVNKKKDDNSLIGSTDKRRQSNFRFDTLLESELILKVLTIPNTDFNLKNIAGPPSLLGCSKKKTNEFQTKTCKFETFQTAKTSLSKTPIKRLQNLKPPINSSLILVSKVICRQTGPSRNDLYGPIDPPSSVLAKFSYFEPNSINFLSKKVENKTLNIDSTTPHFKRATDLISQKSYLNKQSEQNKKTRSKSVILKMPTISDSLEIKKHGHPKIDFVRLNANKKPKIEKQEINIADWIDGSLNLIPPVFQAMVEFSKQSGFFCAASNCHQGKLRDYNEDRVCISTTHKEIIKKKRKNAPDINPETLAMFSIFDGHGSSECSQFLSQKLHSFLLDKLFPDFSKIESQIKTLYNEMDQLFKQSNTKNQGKFSGSCAITLLLLNDGLRVINLGDSRCLLSTNFGKEMIQLTEDHKPSQQSELERITQAGGCVYRTVWNSKERHSSEQRVHSFDELNSIQKKDKTNKNFDFGPWRINPGSLSVSRSFGDFDCKFKTVNDFPGVLISEPVISFSNLVDGDFLLVGCNLIS